jgi:ectoine hydroxylase-related dioxygenase (phytanoyl-CoA dioxygenase family)
MPPEETGFGWHKNMWLHSDQSFTRPGFDCVQSWVTARDVHDGDATLVVLEGSHLHHEEFGKHFGITDKKDWFKLETPEHRAFYEERGCIERYICCPKGSMVFWDSRTIHCGVEAQKDRTEPNHRCVAYLCYKPRSFSTSKFRSKKQKAFHEMRMTNHWPCNGKLFPKLPHTYGVPLKPVEPLPRPVLNDLGLVLAGF